MNNTNYPRNNRQNENNRFSNELQTIFYYLQEHIATGSMVSAATGVPHKNFCRYKRDLEKDGKLWEVWRTYCKQTGFKAWYLTTDPDKCPNRQTQLNLF